MLSTIQNTAISILIYFLVVLLSYGLYHLLKKWIKSEEYLKIARDIFKTTTFLAILVTFQICTYMSFVFDLPLLIVYGVIAIVFLLVLTKKKTMNLFYIQRYLLFYWHQLLRKWFVERLLIMLKILSFHLFLEQLYLLCCILHLMWKVLFIFSV